LQHAHNPVDWFPWGDEALSKAKKENKPILVSIGYSACHWCHVMEKESFEDEQTARIMNENFVNIKIDREERPDLDHIYMDAVQAIAGSGGWPLNVFLTPDARPFFGGTYYPPKKAFNRPSWTDILRSITQLFKERRNEVDVQASSLTDYLAQSNAFGTQTTVDEAKMFDKKMLNESFENIMKSADKEWGGFGKAPKFPQTFTIQVLLRYHYITKNEEALGQALLSLNKMIEGGIYDQVGGGFARYSTDTEWLAPHFEKMLYDNALLVSVLSEAFQITKNGRYREVIEETMDFVCRELLYDGHSNSIGRGFYSALDADSEGEEGKYYVWSEGEVEELLGENAAIFCRYYDITEKGNWEGKNILRVKGALQKFAFENNIPIEKLTRIIEEGKKKLLQRRTSRIPPALDDKIILGWNALMNTACSKAFIATGNIKYRQLAVDNMEFLLEKFRGSDSGGLYHTWKNGQAKYPAFLDDYAFLIQALILLQETTADTKWLKKAKELTEWVIENFSESESGFFYFTGSGQKDVIVRKKEIYDGAVPSGNSVMAYNLYHLSIYFDKREWRERSISLVGSLGEILARHPTSFGIWVCLQMEITTGSFEIAIVGNQYQRLQMELFEYYLPHKVLMASDIENEEFPILAGKIGQEKPIIFLCKDFICQQPVNSIKRFMSLIDKD